MSDLLDDLVRAAREAPVNHDEAEATRRRMLAAATRETHTRSRRRLSPWVLPLVAAFVATGALAAGPTGVRLVTQWLAAAPAPSPASSSRSLPLAPSSGLLAQGAHSSRIEDVDRPAAATPLPPTSASSPNTAPNTAPTSDEKNAAAAPEPAAIAQLPTARASVDTLPTTLPKPASFAGRSSASPPPSKAAIAAPAVVASPPAVDGTAPAVVDPTDELYRTAHERHFRGGDASAAVTAWDRYLAAAPRGRFAPEARYNRALALLRAGRRAEGLVALEPFANGAMGGYRQAEATRLLDAARAP
jgi:hypothetical protein